MRLAGKIAVILVGAGQSPGEGIGNGRATVLRFAQEGARILAVDRDLAAAEETAALAGKEGGEMRPFRRRRDAKEASLAAAMEEAQCGAGAASTCCTTMSGSALRAATPPDRDITAEAFDRVSAMNLEAWSWPASTRCRSWASSAPARSSTSARWRRRATHPLVAYKVSKAGVIASPHSSRSRTPSYGIRANAILPGLMDTPMAVDTRARAWATGGRARRRARRQGAAAPASMGTAWDVANAALFLASDEANFITGVALPVDGGSSLRRE